MSLAGPAGATQFGLQAAAASRGDCEATASHGGGEAGCTWIRSFNLGPMPKVLYWHIDRFADMESAEAARTLYGSVTVALGGQVFLQTVNDNPGWEAPGGERLALVGPLHVPSGPDLEARLMEVTAPLTARLGATSGPKALFVLGGSICLETPAGARDITSRESIVLADGIAARIASSGEGDGRALLLVIHPANMPWASTAPDFNPAGPCTG